MAHQPPAPAESLYVRIAADLRQEIATGQLRDGDRLPGENTLMERYGVARMTARHALAVLRHEGVAVSRRGSGVFVRLFRPIRRHGSGRLARSVWVGGGNIWDLGDREVAVDRLVVERTDPTADVRGQLGLGPGERVVRRSRRYVVDGRPVQVAASYFPLGLVDGTAIVQEDTGPGGVFARLAELGHAPARFSESVTVRMPTPDEAGDLELPAGTPVIAITRLAATSTGRVVDTTRMLLDSSCYVLQYDFDA